MSIIDIKQEVKGELSRLDLNRWDSKIVSTKIYFLGIPVYSKEYRENAQKSEAVDTTGMPLSVQESLVHNK